MNEEERLNKITETIILKTAVEPQSTQKTYAITKRYRDSPVHLLGV